MTTSNSRINFSLGIDKYDNSPKQISVSTFEEFVQILLENRPTEKGKQYVCAPLAKSLHKNPEKHKGESNWRSKDNVLETRILSFDIDFMRDESIFGVLKKYFEEYKAVILSLIHISEPTRPY